MTENLLSTPSAAAVMCIAAVFSSPKFRAALANPEDPSHEFCARVYEQIREVLRVAEKLAAESATFFSPEERNLDMAAVAAQMMMGGMFG